MQSQGTYGALRIFYRPALILASCLLAIGCSSGGKIRSDYDRGADFGSFQTYNFIEDAGATTGENYQSFFSQYMIDAITIEMEKRGYQRAANPDLLVNFNAHLEEKTKVTSTPAMPVGGYYGYRAGFYGGWPAYGYASETHVSQYTQGTFNIDLIDNRRKQLVWEAVGVGRITEKALENLEEGIQTGVPRFFAFYPFVAGNPNPVSQK